MWVVSTSLLLFGVPFALALVDEQGQVEMEREARMREMGNEVCFHLSGGEAIRMWARLMVIVVGAWGECSGGEGAVVGGVCILEGRGRLSCISWVLFSGLCLEMESGIMEIVQIMALLLLSFAEVRHEHLI